MAQLHELDYQAACFTPRDLAREDIILDLKREGRLPIVLVHDGEDLLDQAVCFVLGNNEEPEQSMEISFAQARNIAAAIEKVAHKH